MKNLLLSLLLLISLSASAQSKVYNVQKYCVDELPFKKGECDLSGTEYSFVFVDSAQNKIGIQIAQQKLNFTILSSAVDPKTKELLYELKNPQGLAKLRISPNSKTIELIEARNRILLYFGASTKMGS